MSIEDDLQALRQRLDDLEEKNAVLECINRYCFSVDLRMDQEYLDNLTADCEINLGDEDGQSWHGKAGAASFIKSVLGEIPSPRISSAIHLCGPLKVTLNGDVASAEGYSAVLASSQGKSRIVTSGFNHWDLSRNDGTWRIKRRLRRALGVLAPIES